MSRITIVGVGETRYAKRLGRDVGTLALEAAEAALAELVEDPTLRLATFLVGLGERPPWLGMPLRVELETLEEGVVIPVFTAAE